MLHAISIRLVEGLLVALVVGCSIWLTILAVSERPFG
jgi:hypothetical protein